MALETFARQSLAQFIIIYGEIFDDKAIKPSELESLMWGRMCAKEAGITKTGLKIPFENIKRAKVTLPYMPNDITYTGCCAIKKNGGLYTPCCGKVAEDASYCKTCSTKEGEALDFGSMEDRETNIEDERFAPITFGEWMKGHKTTLTEVYSKLAAAGIALEVPSEELICRTLPKTRRGRPSKSDEEVSDEDSAPKAPKKKPTPKAKAKSPAASEDEAHKKAPKVKPESESEDEKPKKVSPKPSPKASPKASPAASEDEAPKKKVTKPKAESDSESEVEKPKKVSPKPSPKASPKTSPAVSEDEAPKKKEPKAEKVEKTPKADKAPKEKAEKPKEKKADKADKAPKEKAEKPKEKKEEKPKKAKVPEPEPEELDVDALAAAFEQEEPEEDEVETCEVDGKEYNLRNGKYICSKEDGTILGTIDDDGDVVWNSDKR